MVSHCLNNNLLMSKIIELKDNEDEKYYPYGIPKNFILYDNPNGTIESITLDDDVSNYRYIDIFYRNNDRFYSNTRVYEPNDKRIVLSANYTDNEIVYLKNKIVEINGRSISNYNKCYSQIWTNNNGTVSYQNSNNIYIVKVVGYK